SFCNTSAVVLIALPEKFYHFILYTLVCSCECINQIENQFIFFPVFKISISITCLSEIILFFYFLTYQCAMIHGCMVFACSWRLFWSSQRRGLVVYMWIVNDIAALIISHLPISLIG